MDASSVNSANNEATFLGITDFSQFIVTRWQQNLDVPTNVAISINVGNVQLSWDEVSGTNSYKIFASDDPNGTFDDVTLDGSFAKGSITGNKTTQTWESTGTVTKKFYYVVASTETGKIIFIPSQNHLK